MNSDLKLEGISKVFRMGSSSVQALQSIELNVEEGEFVALVGPSGSGKSTLMHILGCLDYPSSGKYWFSGMNTAAMSDRVRAEIRNTHIGFVFQSFNLIPRVNILENVAMPLFYRKHPGDWVKQAEDVLRKVGMAKRRNHRPNELSGGERQRAAIARALITQPKLILADEPTGNLDTRTGVEIMHLLTELSALGHTLIVVTHDASIAAYARRIITLRDGELVEDRLNRREA